MFAVFIFLLLEKIHETNTFLFIFNIVYQNFRYKINCRDSAFLDDMVFKIL